METSKTAVITGASRGIGRAIADAFAAAGYRVVGTATTDAGASSLQSALNSTSGEHLGMVLDAASKDSIQAFCAGLAAAGVTPCVLVNNAGITRDNLLLRMKDEEWEQVIQTNLSAVFHLCRHFIRPMIKARFGRIINIGSVVGASGNAGQANYAAAKAGLTGFTRSLAQEVANRNVTVNAIAPGMIDTDMTRALTDAQREQMIARIPAARLGRVEEIAGLAVYLASDGAGYITGETVHINGGMYMA
ncbi:MAG: 3-oxoacyl-ACP reductase FabG [Gammaproteobacteria bacterium]|nr:3-oxoacyl-ACP reductase FabG [Gammaproteobacteria bacterium]